MNLALIGKNISHSKSKQMYDKLLNQSVNYYLLDYDNEGSIPEIKKIFDTYLLSGLSVTAPYKKFAFDHCDVLTQEAKLVGSVNCLKIEAGKTIGTNTDYLALLELSKKYFTSTHRQVIVLGDGAISDMIKIVFSEEKLVQYSRKMTENFENLDLNEESFENALIVNCCAREYCYKGLFANNTTFWDMNYSHEYHTKNINCSYVDGLSLLEKQAEFALSFWNIQPNINNV